MSLYQKFLNRNDEAVLAYVGGPFAYGKDRRLRVDAPRPLPGFHRFVIRGRSARALEPVEAPELDALPRVRGHHVRGWIVSPEQKAPERVHLVPSEEPAPLAIVRARRWHSGDLVFDALDFDGEVEEAARLRLEDGAPLAGLRGTSPSLRIAYGIALALAVASRRGIALSVREALAPAARIAEEGEAHASTYLLALDAHRAEEADRARVRALMAGQTAREPIVAYRARPQDAPTLDNAALRAETALDAANARMLSTRRLGDRNLEVAFQFMGERFVSVVDAITLHVYDAGVCLAGADELVTLDSLPSVIREAIDEDLLVITRR